MRHVDLLIYNALIVNEGRQSVGWVTVDGGLIEAVGEGEAPRDIDAADVHDAGGAMLMPGIIDEHVHFRDPGLTHKGDMMTESRAAAAGGVTSFIDMPNTRPATVTIAALDEKNKRAAEVSTANYAFYLGVTNDNTDELLKADYTRVAGVKLFLGSSTGNMLVDNEATLRRVFTEVPALIAVHAESESRIRANRERIVARMGEELPVSCHPAIRDAEACREATAAAIALARETGARLHVMHVSTAAETELLTPGDAAGKRVTAETCPQYLLFDDSRYADLGARIKCNPAIKSADDRRALYAAIRDGRIDVIATDHAPHLPAEKEGTALTAVSGMPMIQFSLPLMLTLAPEIGITEADVVRLMCHAPATIYRIEGRGFIRPGYHADLTLVERTTMTVADSDAISRCGWTPLAGTTLDYRVVSTWLNGRRVYDGTAVHADIRGEALVFARPPRE